jgi:hypothetical protein
MSNERETVSNPFTKLVDRVNQQVALSNGLLLHYDTAVNDLRPWQW